MLEFEPVKVGIMGFKNSHAIGMFQAMRTSPLFKIVAVSIDSKYKSLLESHE